VKLHLKRRIQNLYPECTDRDIEDFIAAIKFDKYCSGLPGRRDLIYVVALTKAKIPLEGGFQARATHLKRVLVSEKASPFCRWGVILAAINIGGRYVANTVLTWPAFLKIMRGKAEEAHQLLSKPSGVPPYLDVKDIVAL